MAENTPEEKQEPISFWVVVLGIIVAIFLYLYTRFEIKDANEKLAEHLQDKKEALDDIYLRIEYYRKRKVEIIRAKRLMKAFLRIVVSAILAIANWFYVYYYYPNNITLQHVFESIATFNAALFFIIGISSFAFFGNFLEIRSAYHSFQTKALEFMFKKDEETIEAVLKLDLENREAIRKEMAETEQAIKNNEELLNPKLEPQTATTDIVSLN